MSQKTKIAPEAKSVASRSENPANEVATSKRVGKFFIIGLILALSNYLLYTFLAIVIISNNNLLWLSSLISTSIATILAYILHSRITWKERTPSKKGVINFFLWNALLAIFVCPFLTWAFGFITPLYEFAYNVSVAIHLPFDYEFVESTGIFVLVNIITMILNYLFYDKLVFEKSEETK